MKVKRGHPRSWNKKQIDLRLISKIHNKINRGHFGRNGVKFCSKIRTFLNLKILPRSLAVIRCQKMLLVSKNVIFTENLFLRSLVGITHFFSKRQLSCILLSNGSLVFFIFHSELSNCVFKITSLFFKVEFPLGQRFNRDLKLINLHFSLRFFFL